MVQVTPLRKTLAFSPYQNALVAIREGMRAVKLSGPYNQDFISTEAKG